MKTTCQGFWSCLAILAALHATIEHADAGAIYQFTNLGDRSAVGLNDAGQVAGSEYVSPSSMDRPFLYDSLGPASGTIQGVPGIGWYVEALGPAGQVAGNSSNPNDSQNQRNVVDVRTGALTQLPSDMFHVQAINGDGQVLGTISNYAQGKLPQSVIFDGGTTTPLPNLPGAYMSSGIAMNASGQVVGYARMDQANDSRAFLYSDGKLTDLGSLSNGSSGATAINDSGTAAGSSTAADGSIRAVLFKDGAIQDLGALPGSSTGLDQSTALGINDKGEVVGQSNGHPFLYEAGKMIDLTDFIPPQLLWKLIEVNAINNQGQILGSGVAPDGYRYSFLLTPSDLGTPIAPPPTPERPLPVPEPGAITMFAVISLWVLYGRFRGRRA